MTSDLWTPEGVRLPSGVVLPPIAGGDDFSAHMALLGSKNVISTVGIHGIAGVNGGYPVVSNGSGGVANRGSFIPVRIVRPTLITQLGYFCNVAVGNVDLGIYDWTGTRIVSSGAVAAAGAAVMQWIDITDTLIAPGLFYWAMSCSSSICNVGRLALTPSTAQIMGLVIMAAAHPLPANATFAATNSGQWPVIVASQGSVV